MKRFIIVIACMFALAALGAAAAVWLFASRHWDGAGEWTFRVKVVDADNQRPIAQAAASIVISNEYPFGAVESYRVGGDSMAAQADDGGVCLLTSRFPCYGYESRVRSTAFMNFRNRTLRVQAPGFTTVERPLTSFIASPWPLTSAGSTTEVTVALKKLQSGPTDRPNRSTGHDPQAADGLQAPSP